jgi:tetratricopeptide (TPR) repeat protein
LHGGDVRRNPVRGLPALLLLLGAFACALTLKAPPAGAQAYGDQTPIPRSTDPAVLRGDARRREVHERFARGLAAYERGDFTNAAAEFGRIVSLDPREPQRSTAHYDLGLALAGAGRLDLAAREFEAAALSDPGFLAALADLVSVDLERGDAAGARRAAGRLLALAPDSARALYGAGLAALRAGDAAAARDAFSTLLKKNPAYATAHYDVALAELRLGRYGEAEREIRAALDLAPRFARAHLALGMVLLHAQRRPEARAEFESARRLSNDVALRNLAGALIDTLASAR